MVTLAAPALGPPWEPRLDDRIRDNTTARHIDATKMIPRNSLPYSILALKCQMLVLEF